MAAIPETMKAAQLVAVSWNGESPEQQPINGTHFHSINSV